MTNDQCPTDARPLLHAVGPGRTTRRWQPMSARDTILIAEDNPDEVLLIRRAFRLAKLDYPLQVVSNGDAAIAYLGGEGQYADRSQYPLPTLMLLDLKMPRKSGLEVLEWLRDQPGLRRLRVVVLTASRESADVDQAYELGA